GCAVPSSGRSGEVRAVPKPSVLASLFPNLFRPSAPASTAAAAPRSKLDDEAEYVPASPPRLGVGSNGTQPHPRNQTSTHMCASRSETTHWPLPELYWPLVKPTATRDGMPR